MTSALVKFTDGREKWIVYCHCDGYDSDDVLSVGRIVREFVKIADKLGTEKIKDYAKEHWILDEHDDDYFLLANFNNTREAGKACATFLGLLGRYGYGGAYLISEKEAKRINADYYYVVEIDRRKEEVEFHKVSKSEFNIIY